MQQEYDVVVTGGGILGCGVAQATAAAGFKTLLIEQNQWGSATSCSSSKLVHGGLRYLETTQFSLVRECLEERDWMLDSFPDLVKPNWFYFPLYRDSTIPPWKLFWGLSIYQALCGYSRYSRFRRVPRKEWKNLGGLATEGLEAVFAYQDGQTDDRLLTQRVQQSAEKLGADCLEGTRLTRAVRFQDGFQVCMTQGKKEHCIKAQFLVNATGPWVNHTLSCVSPAIDPLSIELVQGSHIVLQEQISDHCFYLQAPTDRRVVFVLPWQGKTLVGTTETPFSGDPKECKPQEAEINYLTGVLRHYFPGRNLTVEASFSGLRVLPKSEDRPFFRPRDAILKADKRLVSIYGGKLTTWRATAEEVLEEIETQLGNRTSINTRMIDL